MKKGQVPLERALSKLGLASRTEARTLVREGRVAVNGHPVTDPLFAVAPESARIEIDGQKAALPRPVTILLHKPRGVVTSRSDPEGRPTVYGCLEGLDAHVVPVGRLDVATSGLLLLTNDTRFSDWVTDPRNGIPRVYLVTVRGELSDDQARRLEEGIVTVRKRSKRETHLVVELTEGKNREIRRMLAGVGHEVTKLKRVSFGGLELGELPPGRWREVTREELQAAFPKAPRTR